MERQESLDVLGLSGTPTTAQIKAAHRAQSKRNHPDVGGSDAAMTDLNLALGALLDETPLLAEGLPPSGAKMAAPASEDTVEVPELWSQLLFFAGVPIALIIVLVFVVVAISGM